MLLLLAPLLLAGLTGAALLVIEPSEAFALAAQDDSDDVGEVDDDDDGDDNEDDVPITGEALEKASAAALAHVGEGQVTETEVDNDADGYYEVEITLENGREVEVNLSENFEVLGTEEDD
jgi:uncharacterized membrane protein YkoI